MPICTKPLIRAETIESYINKKGGISYKVEWLDRVSWDNFKKSGKNERVAFHGKYRRIQEIPCGQCIECKLNYSREWATRAMLEKKYHNPNECFFITLTYNDEHIPFHEVIDTETGESIVGMSLNKKDLQDFWKRVRKKFSNAKIKYINAGEYGGETLRPHYHAIVYGLPLNTSLFKKIGMSPTNEPYWQSPELDKLWGKGFVTIGELTWQSAAYVARYTLKKAKGSTPELLQAMGKKPEFVSMSQGIGKEYFEENMKNIYETDSVPVINTKTGQLVKPPKSFDRLLKEVDNELYESIKKQREESRISGERAQEKQTDLTPEERRKQKQEIFESSFKDIRKEL